MSQLMHGLGLYMGTLGRAKGGPVSFLPGKSCRAVPFF
jgi:hypothetical protein